MKLKKLRKILKEMEGGAPANSVAANSTPGNPSIAGASPGETPPVNLQKRKRVPDFPKLRRNKPNI